jgi:hypothetical protein
MRKLSQISGPAHGDIACFVRQINALHALGWHVVRAHEVTMTESLTATVQDSADQIPWFAPIATFVVYHAFVLALLLFGSFNVYDLILVFYIELIVIGLHALARLLAGLILGDPFSSDTVEVGLGARLVFGVMLAGFFIGKYGLLMLALGVVIIMLPNEIGISWAEQTELHPMVAWCWWLLLARYGLAFLWHSILRADYRNESVLSLLLFPYIQGLWVGAAIAAGLIVAAVYESDSLLIFTAGVFLARFVPGLIGALIESRLQIRRSG